MTRLKLKYNAWMLLALLVAGVGGFMAWQQWTAQDQSVALISGNGRMEATSIDVATKAAGRLQNIQVKEGDLVAQGDVLARMDTASLEASRAESSAALAQAQATRDAAQSQVLLRRSDVDAAKALVQQRDAELAAAHKRVARTRTLTEEGASSRQDLDDDEARVATAQATLLAARAQVRSAQAAVEAAQAQQASAMAAIDASRATLARIEVDLGDAALRAPRPGRVQYLVARQGEVLGAGGKVLSLLDIGDVYMNFFAPEKDAGRVAIGSEVRIVLDAQPDVALPAKVSFVSDAAQFTPKTVETASEREKLMFRVRAQIAPELLASHSALLKSGLPGVAYLRPSPDAPWPARLQKLLQP